MKLINILLTLLFSSSVIAQIDLTPINRVKIDSLRNKLTQKLSDEEEMQVLLDLVKTYSFHDSLQTNVYFKKGIQLSKKLNDTESQFAFKLAKGRIYSTYNLYKKEIDYYKNLYEESKSQNLNKYLIMCLNQLGAAYSKNNEYSKALEYLKISEDIYDKFDDKGSLSNSPYQNLSVIYFNLGILDKSIDYCKKNVEFHSRYENKKQLISANMNLAILLKHYGNIPESLALLEQCLSDSKRNNFQDNISVLYVNLGVTNYYQNNLKLAKAYLLKRIEIKDNSQERIYESNFALLHLSYIYYEQDQLDSSSIYFNKYIANTKNLPNKTQYLLGNLEFGIFLKEKGRLSESFEYFLTVLNESQKNDIKVIAADAYSNIADIFFLQEKYKKSQHNFKSALDIYTDLDYSSHAAKILIKTSEIYQIEKKYEQAIDVASQALETYISYGDSCSLSSCYLSLGISNFGIEEIELATNYLNLALLQAEECSKNETLAKAHLAMGNIFLYKKSETKAIASFKKSIDLLDSEIGNEVIKNASNSLYMLYNNKGSYKNALKYHQLYHSNRDSILNNINSRQIIEKEFQYDYEKKEYQRKLDQQKIDLVKDALLQRQKWFLYLAFISLIAIAAVAYSQYKSIKNKRKVNTLLKEKNVQIANQKKELEDLDDQKSRFFANISHELRTPLTLISSPIDNLLSNEIFSAKIREELELVKRNSSQLKSLVNDIMDLTKLESNRLDLVEKEIELVPFLNRIGSNFTSLAEHLKINYDINNSLTKNIVVKIDPGKIEKIINNLISNAIKHTPADGQIEVNYTSANDNLIVKVIDTGKGIPAEDLPFIFNRYFQSSNNTSDLQGGTGIGLALVNDLTQLMKGSISVESKVDIGSSFQLTIPIQEVQNSQTVSNSISNDVYHDSTLAIASKSQETNVGPKDYTVLIVEDHQDMQNFINSLLNTNYHTHLANNGKQALEILKCKSIDLIISDVMMPEMDGYTLLNELKENDAYRNIPVIMLTALDTRDNKLKALKLGVDDYLNKPFSPEELHARAENLLERYMVRKSFNEELSANPQALKQDLKSQDISTRPSSENEWIAKVQEIMVRELENESFNLTNLASQLFLGERQFQRRMKSLTGLTPKKFQTEVALQHARELLENRSFETIKAVSYSVGMSNVYRFSQLYEKRFGINPKEYM